MPAALGGETASIVGRDGELAKLRSFLEQEGARRALVIAGEAGIGKTTLWEACVAAARGRGAHVLVARPSEAEARLSLAALADLAEGVDPDLLDSLPAPQRYAVEVALLRCEPVGRAPEPRAVASAFRHLLARSAAHGRVVVAIDDVQWLDSASRDAIGFAARRVRDDAVLFLLTERAEGLSTIGGTFEPRDLCRIEVRGLSLGAMRRLLAERLGLEMSRRMLRRIFDATRGNPLFALEVGAALLENGSGLAIGDDLPVPRMVDELLGARIGQLAGAERTVLLSVALDSSLRPEQLAIVAREGDAIERAVRAGLLLVDGERVRASHPLLLAVAKRHASDEEQRALQGELANVVDDDELRARHLALAARGPDARLAAILARAAASAAARGAVEDAVELAEHALRLTPPWCSSRHERLLALAEYLLVAGEPRRLEDVLVPEIEQLPAGTARARAHLLLADSQWVWSHASAYGRHLDLALAESGGDSALRATVLARMSRLAAVGFVEDISGAEALACEALALAGEAGPNVEREALHALAWARVLRGRTIDDLSERFEAVSGDAFHLVRSPDRAAAERLVLRGDIARGRLWLQELLRLADERGEMLSYVTVRLQLCELELRVGAWAAAERHLDEWQESPDRDLSMRPAYERCRALLAVGRGDPREAERWVARAIAGSRARGWRWDELEARRVGAVAALFAHEPERACESLRAVWEHTLREGLDEPAVFPAAPDLVEALVEVGEIDEARAVTERLTELALDQDHPWGRVTAIRCDALVRLAAHAEEDSASMLQRAAAGYDTLGLRFDRARSLLLLGSAERRRRHWGEARRWLEQAATAFDELGSPGWSDQARAELGRVGGRRPRGEGELTPGEQRVAELARDGLSNKEIARTLVVSVHTVEVQLSRAYAKLGVRSRAQLASRLPTAR